MSSAEWAGHGDGGSGDSGEMVVEAMAEVTGRGNAERVLDGSREQLAATEGKRLES